ncbi:alpha/beta fold hydrolase [Amycolatopsis sp. MtRt-6]|uniref:alpha/beta fold hydrolase n=1 Tax=Amycolatopsis sp. MtRt-6 TaxID=2792782 RepID=UPI001A8F6EE3|nr:alpha/beta hydrolase [Amycolatopsis sp. MtRt-6]
MKLWTTDVGDGPKRAALIHGLTGDSGTWFELAPWIAGHGYTVTLVDQRGHGQSERADSYTPEDLAGDLVETLPTGLDLVIGHSLGGRSLTLAAERLAPKQAVYLDPGWIIPDDLEITPPQRPDGSWMSVEELAPLLPGFSRAHVEQALRAVKLFDLAHLEAPAFPLATLLPPEEPVVPSLVVVADPSRVVPPDLQDRLQRGGYTVRVVPGGGHDLHVLNLEATKHALADRL